MDALKRGYSLAESVIGMLILLAGFVVMVRLYDAALRQAAATERQALATVIAERELERIKTWSQDEHAGGRAFSDWSGVTGTHQADGYSDFEVEVQVFPVELAVPSSQLESGLGPLQKRLDASVARVEVEVRHREGSLRLAGLLTEPRRTNPVVTVTPVGGGSLPLARDGALEFEASAFADGGPLEDVAFGWKVTGVGNGTLELLDRSGRRVRFRNRIEIPGQGVTYSTQTSPGATCRVEARVVYYGEEVSGQSDAFELQ
ncbi:MAG: hypothetical protein AB7S38_08340 [Vulcanimicrobiota bacterium]